MMRSVNDTPPEKKQSKVTNESRKSSKKRDSRATTTEKKMLELLPLLFTIAIILATFIAIAILGTKNIKLESVIDDLNNEIIVGLSYLDMTKKDLKSARAAISLLEEGIKQRDDEISELKEKIFEHELHNTRLFTSIPTAMEIAHRLLGSRK